MKIAVVFYGKFTGRNKRGEIQSFEKSYEFLEKNILKENVDVFLHGWNDDFEESQKLLELYKPKKYLLEKQISFDHPYKHYDFVPHGPWNTKDYLNNNYSRFYSIKKAIELVDEDYDLVLLTRYDTIFFQPFPFESMSPENFYVSHWFHNQFGLGFQDAWFISGYGNIKNWSLIYDRLDEYFNLDSEYVNFLEKNGGDLTNLPSGHAITRYRTVELGITESIYCVGVLPETWTLERYLNNTVMKSNETVEIKKLD
jgi:hypothetical protein